MMKAKLKIGGRDMEMRASALLPRLYRAYFGRDMICDMRKLKKAYDAVNAENENATEEEKQDAQLSVIDLTIFENVAWLMLKHGGEKVGEDPNEWLDSVDGVFSIYEILPVMLNLWGLNNATTSVPKKK